MTRFYAFIHTNAAWLSYLAVALLVAIPLFSHLDELPMLTWDELHNAQNALEMNQNGNRIVTYISHRPETWNTKPPLLTWILAFTQSTFGYSELSVRLPSALFAAMTCFYLLALLRRHTGRWSTGLLAVIILITSGGYVTNHGTRTGDYDSLLTLCSTIAAGAFLDYLRFRRQRALFTSILAFTGAVMTKGVAGLFITPALLGLAIWTRNLGAIFRSRGFWAGLAVFVLIVGGYYLRRGQLQPGYLQLVWENELGGRYGASLETHQGDFWYYWRWVGEGGFSYWYFLLLPAAFAAVLNRDPDWRRLGVTSLACLLSIMLIIGTAATKLGWYMLPAYPFMAILCALFLEQACMLLHNGRFWSARPIPALLLIALAVPAYISMAQRSMASEDPYTAASTQDAGIYLKEALEGKRALNANVLCGDDYPLYWHREVFILKGRELRVVDTAALQPGMRVMLWEEPYKSSVRRRYHISPIEQFQSVEIMRIDSVRHEPAKG